MDIGKTSNLNIQEYKLYTKKNLAYTEATKEVPKSGKSFNGDSFIISDEANDLLSKEKYMVDDENRLNEFHELLKELRQAADSNKDPMSGFIKCLEIARRIINGHRVPVKDIKFLAVTEPEMYTNAILLRKQNNNPKNYDSLLKDEKDARSEITSEETISSKIIETSLDIEA